MYAALCCVYRGRETFNKGVRIVFDVSGHETCQCDEARMLMKMSGKANRLCGSGLLFAVSVACTDSRSNSSAVTVRDSSGIVIVENDLARLPLMCVVGDAPTIAIGSTDGASEYELHRVFGASRLGDGRIVLVNQGSSQLRFYDASGRFLMSAGRSGSGPGEFRDAFYLWVLPGDTIWVGDYDPWQFLVFSPAGHWVRTVRPTPEYVNSPAVINVLDDGRAVLAQQPLRHSAPASSLATLRL
jgi:hypothetical protein